MAENFDLQSLYSAMDDDRSRRALTWSGVAKEIEECFARVSLTTIKGIGDRPRVEGDRASIFSALDRRRTAGNMTWSTVANEIGGITPLQLKNMAKGGRTSLPEVMKAVV